MRFTVFLLVLIGLTALVAQGQTISPLVGECGGKKCSGQFTVTNNQILPMAVSIDVYAISFDASGNVVRHPLDATTHVKLSETSARVAPRQAHEFSYTASCDALPCVLGFGAVMSAGHVDNGIQAKLVLITGLYICETQKGCRASVRAKYGL